jgi:hypothetical protein
LLLYFDRADRNPEEDDELTVWENLILLRAENPDEAYRKAVELGRAHEEPVRVDDNPGYCKFLGLADLVLIYDKLEDGAELEWHERTSRASELRQLARAKERLHAFNLDPKGSND